MFLGLGQAVYFSLKTQPSDILLAFALLIALAGMWLSRHYVIPFFCWLMLVFAVLGGGIVQAHLYMLQGPVLKKTLYTENLQGKILSLEPRNGRTRLVITPDDIAGLSRDQLPQKVRLSLSGDIAVRPGDYFSGKAKIFPLSVPETPGDPDFARNLYFDGIGGTGFALGRSYRIDRDQTADTGFFEAIERIRLAIMARIDNGLEPAKAGLANAILVGERGGVAPELAEDLRKSGLAHLLAISGLHMGLLCGVVFFTVRFGLALFPSVALRYPIKKWAAIAGFIIGTFYLLLSGATVPTQRAFVMTAIVLFAVLVDRRAISLRLVAIAAVIVMVLRPDAILGASFQLSFAAVTVLVAFYQGKGGRLVSPQRDLPVWQRIGRYLFALFITGIMVTAVTAPIIGFHFGRISLLGVLSNLVAIPLMAFWIMPGIVAVLVLLPFGLEGIALGFLAPGLDMLIALAHLVARQDWGLWHIAQPPALAVILAMLALLWLIIWRQRVLWLCAIVPAVGAAIAIIGVQSPDLLVGGDQKDWALYQEQGDHLVFNNRVSRFHRDIWNARFGTGFAPEKNAAKHCDQERCWFKKNGKTIVISDKIDDPFYLCRHADVIVILKQDFPVSACNGSDRSPLVIDDDVLWWQGGVAVFLGDQQSPSRYETVRQTSGNWSWIIIGGR
ncbi:ComEC/Rec2 family competence protein [Thalassospira sp. TSL5-1]|uniref:ComEC/Rec2 family competence protein n=1 Tax=Thalassospira sp. TSL5-1 TaxID=1544451 RepID=UPI000AAD950B|nr:ComEC/Rec2 family competence protein [Thalassospira sp. TSL5-1]